MLTSSLRSLALVVAAVRQVNDILSTCTRYTFISMLQQIQTLILDVVVNYHIPVVS